MIKIFDYHDDFPLEGGGSLPGIVVAYHVFGTPNAAGTNYVWVCHALTANSDVADWWPGTVEPGRFLDIPSGKNFRDLGSTPRATVLSVPTSWGRAMVRQGRCRFVRRLVDTGIRIFRR